MLPSNRMPLLWPLLLALAAPALATSVEWVAAGSGEGSGYGYQVFTAKQEGEDFYRHEVRGWVRAAPASLSEAVRTITSDPARAPDGQSRRILQSDDEAFVVHTRIELPYPFSDRDIVTRGVRREHGAGLRIDWEAIEHPEAPRSEDVVRIERSAGTWTFVPRDDGATEVLYHSYSDPAGALPGWLVEPMTERNMAQVFEAVAREAMDESRRAAALP